MGNPKQNESPAKRMRLLNELLAPKWEVAQYNPITKKFIVKKFRDQEIHRKMT